MTCFVHLPKLAIFKLTLLLRGCPKFLDLEIPVPKSRFDPESNSYKGLRQCSTFVQIEAFLCISACKNQEVVAFPVFSEIRMRKTKIKNLFLTSIVRFLFNCKCYGLVCFHKEFTKVEEAGYVIKVKNATFIEADQREKFPWSKLQLVTKDHKGLAISQTSRTICSILAILSNAVFCTCPVLTIIPIF